MSILDIARDNPAARIDSVISYLDAREELDFQSQEYREAREDLLKIADAFDNVGWSPLDTDEAKEMPLKTVKKIAEISRSLVAVNPFVKSGVGARIEYIWGKGVSFDGVGAVQEKIDRNRKKVFSTQAYEEFERALATDGNVFSAVPIKDDPIKAGDPVPVVFRIPLDQITGIVANPDDSEEIWFYKREYSITITNGQGEERKEDIIKYYASFAYYERLDGAKLPRNRFGKGVDQNFVIQHTTVNKQVGWRWGLPDVTSVIFWAKAYKEYLEDNATLVKAYSRLAWQYKASTANAGMSAAAQALRPPSRDPLTGESRDVGGTAFSVGGELAPVAATGSQVNFDNGSALASAIAAGLEVSKVVITRDPGSGNRATAETLDLPTLKAMESRQRLHTERFLELFEFWGAKINTDVQATKDAQEAALPVPPKNAAQTTDVKKTGNAAQTAEPTTPKESDVAIVSWPQIESDTTKDRITAIGTAVELGILYKQEGRKDALDVLGIAPYKPWYELPMLSDDPAKQEQQNIDQQNQEVAFQREQQAASVIAKQGVSGGVAAKGGSQTSANAARNARTKDSGK